MTVRRASREPRYVINVKDYGVTGNGSTDDYSRINDAITAIGSDERILYFPYGTYYIGTSITVPANITVQFDRGAIVQDNGTAGVVFTINGQLDAGPYQIFNFTGAGSGVTLGNGGECWLNWWCDGGTGTSTDPWTSSIDGNNGLQSAHDAGATVIKGTAGYYASNTEANWITNNISLLGEGKGITNFIINGAMIYWLDINASGLTIRDFTVIGSIAYTVSVRYRTNSVTAGMNFEKFDLSTLQRVNFEGIYGSAIRFHRAIRSKFYDLEATFCGDIGKPTWHFDNGTSVDNDVVQGGHFSGMGFELNFNDTIWRSESSGGNGEGSVSNTYEAFRFENSTVSYVDVTVTLGIPSNGDAVTITGGITATMENYQSTVYGDVMQLDSASAYTFTTGNVITGPAGAWTATIGSRVDIQNGQFINWNDQGKHRISDMHFNRSGVLTSGYAVDIGYTDYCSFVNLRFSGNHVAGAMRLNNANYASITNLIGAGSTGVTEDQRLLLIENSSDVTVINANGKRYGGILISGVNADRLHISNSVFTDAGDIAAGGIIESDSTSITGIVLSNISVIDSTTTGDAFKLTCNNSLFKGCRVEGCTADYAFKIEGHQTTLDDCHVFNHTGSGVYTIYDDVSIKGCLFNVLSKNGIVIEVGADSTTIQNCRLRNYASDGAGFYGVYLNGSNKSFGCIVSGCWFDAGANTPTNDLYIADGYLNAQIIGNNFENMSANGVRIGSGANKQIYGNVGALENKLSVIPVSVSTVNDGEDNLMTAVLPQYSNDVFELIRVRAAGTKTNLNGNKTLKFYFGASFVEFHPAANDEVNWQFEAEIVMYADNSHRCSWTGKHVSLIHGYDVFTDDLNSGAVTLKITGECAHTDDTITQTMFVVKLL